MAIYRVSPTGWQFKSTLKASQLNQLDKNATYGIDKRLGYTDNISSHLTVENGGSITLQPGSILNIDPMAVVLYPGTLFVGCEIQGDEYNNSTLRFGWTSYAGTSSATVPAATYCKGIIKLTGTLTSNVVLKFPSRVIQSTIYGGTQVTTLYGWSKIIDNATIQDGYTLTLTPCNESGTSTGTSIQLPERKPSFVYCDGANMVLGPGRSPYTCENIQYRTANVSPGTLYYTFTSAEDIETLTFTNVAVGDLYEIMYTAGLQNVGSPSDVGSLYVNVAGVDIANTIWLTYDLNTIYNTFTTTYVATVPGTNVVKLKAGTAGAYNIYSPYNFSVKLIKR